MNSLTGLGMRSLLVRRGGAAMLREVSRPRAAVCCYGARWSSGESASPLPTIAQPSFWRSLVPKPLRRAEGAVSHAAASKKVASKEWNPATFYIVIFLCIGSMSIQMISLKKNFDTFMRQSEAKIGLLREVVERIQKGEDVDVERVLGTGDPEKEAEWEAALKELERDNVSKSPKRADKKDSPAPATSQPAEVPDATAAKPVKAASITSFY